mgnify:CR=1 FL=1
MNQKNNENKEINLDTGDIIIEVNREIVESIKSFISLVEKYRQTGREVFKSVFPEGVTIEAMDGIINNAKDA